MFLQSCWRDPFLSAKDNPRRRDDIHVEIGITPKTPAAAGERRITSIVFVADQIAGSIAMSGSTDAKDADGAEKVMIFFGSSHPTLRSDDGRDPLGAAGVRVSGMASAVRARDRRLGWGRAG